MKPSPADSPIPPTTTANESKAKPTNIRHAQAESQRARTRTAPIDSTPQPTLESLKARYHRRKCLVARGVVLLMEIEYLKHHTAYHQAREQDPNHDAPEPPIRQLSQYDEDEFQFLAHSGVKMCHPIFVHPARTKLATRIYREFYQIYAKCDLDALWSFLRTSHARLQAIPLPPIDESDERRTIEQALLKLRKIKFRPPTPARRRSTAAPLPKDKAVP